MTNPAKQDLLEAAKKTLARNLKTGFSPWANIEFKYHCPDKDHYPHQWFWDSCFHAIVLSHFDISEAKNEIRSLLYGQKPDGFIPHIIFWSRKGITAPWHYLESAPTLSPKISSEIQPPLIAEAVEAIYKKDQDRTFLYEVLPKLTAFYKYLGKNRDPDQDGLITIIAPFESGLDQSPSFDPVLSISNQSALANAIAGRVVSLRNLWKGYNLEKIFAADYFNVEDVLVNSIYIQNLLILVKLLLEIDDEENARAFKLLAKKAQDSLVEKCFDKKENFFFDLYGKTEEKAKVKTIKGLLPLILDLPSSIVDKIVKQYVGHHDEFGLPYPFPSVSKSEGSFSSSPMLIHKEPIIWRGPSWINTNWYVIKGLKKHGFKKEAEEAIKKSVELIDKNGFREFFNPYSGEGYGAKNFGWSTLVVDMILS